MPSTEERGQGFTLYGAISPCLKDNGYFEVHNSTKGPYYIEFMRNIQHQILPSFKNKRLILVADNHGAHKGATKMAICNQFCEVHFIPPYSCELNGPIETAWSVIKRRVIPKFTKLQLKMKSSRAACIACLKKELLTIEPAIYSNLMRSHYCYLTTLLEKARVDYEQVNGPL